MKQKPTSKPFFDPEEMAAALAVAPASPIADPDNPPTNASDWRDAISSQSLTELRQKLAVRRRGPGRAPRKTPTTIRFDPDVLAALKATCPGWQTRVNEVMREWLRAHPLKIGNASVFGARMAYAEANAAKHPTDPRIR